MRLTTKGRYAVTAMLDVALHQDTGPVALIDVAARQAISLSYLEQLFARIRRCDLVNSTRGPGGGYSLKIPAKEISVLAIIEAVDENVDARACKGNGDCDGGARCLTHDLWNKLSQSINHFLDDVSLQDLIDKHELKLALQPCDGAPMRQLFNIQVQL